MQLKIGDDVADYNMVDFEMLKHREPCRIWIFQPGFNRWRLVVDHTDPTRMHFSKQVEILLEDKSFAEKLANSPL